MMRNIKNQTGVIYVILSAILLLAWESSMAASTIRSRETK